MHPPPLSNGGKGKVNSDHLKHDPSGEGEYLKLVHNFCLTWRAQDLLGAYMQMNSMSTKFFYVELRSYTARQKPFVQISVCCIYIYV